MDLCYYGIKVGVASKESIKVENEINQNDIILTEDDLTNNKKCDENMLPIYDIIIAGVKND